MPSPMDNAARFPETDLKQVLWELESGLERRQCLIVLVGCKGSNPTAADLMGDDFGESW